MRYLVLACDYDGTIATHGHVDENTVQALERVLASGRKLLMVTGRELDDLQAVFPRLDLFEWVVAENGALLYQPATRELKPLADLPPKEFVRVLSERGVAPISTGHIIVATWEPHETVVLETIRDLGLELQVIFNKGAVMVLPAGVNKASGLQAALKEMGLSPHNVVGVGDAENDHAFLSICECSAAVANALSTVKEKTDLVTRADHGAGVTELIAELIENDLSARHRALDRHSLLLGHSEDGSEVTLPPHGSSVLIAGPSASGKSTAATALMERLAERGYQFCVVDPEGDYGGLDPAVHLGKKDRSPSVEEVLEVLKSPEQNVVINLVGLALRDRPTFFHELLPHIQELRARTGRPHWLVIDEAHHLLPTAREPASRTLPQLLEPVLLVTVHPDEVSPAILAPVNTLMIVGQAAEETLDRFCKVVGGKPPRLPADELQTGEVFLWTRDDKRAPFRVKVLPGKTERRRHNRKYAEGELPPDRSFYFRGPDDKLNLRAQNLFLFLQLAEGVDDETWLHHLRAGDYSRWVREGVKNESLAAECEQVERDETIDARESRQRLRSIIEKYYTLPAAAAVKEPAQKR